MASRSDQPINVAIFGFGRIGRIHFQNLQLSQRVHVKWIIDDVSFHQQISEEMEKYGTSLRPKVASIQQTDMVLADHSIAAVFVCSPSFCHEDTVVKALSAEKHVFCEKPLALTIEAIQTCFEMAERYKRTLFCAFNKRFDPEFEGLYKQKQNGDFGKIRQLVMVSRDPPVPISYIKISGGIFQDSCIHQLDYVCYFIGERPLTVAAHGNTTSSKADEYRQCSDVDLALIVLTFPSETIAVIETSRESMYGFDQRLEVYGSKLLGKSKNQLLPSCENSDSSGGHTTTFPDCFGRFADSYVAEEHHFLDAVQGVAECLVTSDDCHQACELAQLCEESFRSGQVIQVPTRSSRSQRP